jgi:membrane protein implicated in regulation of membrane protease activity
MTGRVLFLATFVAGLGLAVYSMLHGVERSRISRRTQASRKVPQKRPSAIFNAPSGSTFATVLGATGYLLVTRTATSLKWILVIPLMIALVATAGMIVLMSKWALPYSGLESEAELIQGQLARVTSPISPSRNGEITFDTDGVTRTVAAQSIHGSEIPRDTEVVIDTIEDGIARVEPWSAVEARL